MANSFSIELTPDQYQAVKAKALQHGIDPTSDKVLPPVDGVYLKCLTRMTGTGFSLGFEVVKKPFYVSMDVIENHVKALIGG